MNQEIDNPSKCPICGRPTHKESKYCIFHAGAEEKTEEEFKEALKEYIEIIKKENMDYSFYKFIFIGFIDFEKDFDITVFKNASFSEANFKGVVNFSGIKFDGNTHFIGTIFKQTTFFTKVTFKSDSIFMKAIFLGDANFTTTTFNGEADFKSTKFENFTRFNFLIFNGLADFREATFKMSTEFKNTSFMSIGNFEDVKFNGHTSKFINTTFKSDANFFVVKFKGNADFREAIFNRDATFEEAIFENDFDFRCKYFSKDLNFSKIKTFLGNKIFIKVHNREGVISFDRAHLENTVLDIDLIKGVSIDFTEALLNNTKIDRVQIENHIFQENKMKFREAQEIYNLLKNNFYSLGQSENEKWAYMKGKNMNRLLYSYSFYLKKLEITKKKEKLPFLNWLKKGYFWEWVTSTFLNALYGYGEKPLNVIFSAGILIFAFALIFSNIGIGNPEVIELNGTAIHQNTGNVVDLASKGLIKNNIIRNFPDSLYFSLITFTTLGYGDFRPLAGWGRILAGSEAFIGAFMMALFVYTFARRTGGR